MPTDSFLESVDMSSYRPLALSTRLKNIIVKWICSILWNSSFLSCVRRLSPVLSDGHGRRTVWLFVFHLEGCTQYLTVVNNCPLCQ